MANLQATDVAGTLTDLRTENVKTGSHTLATADRNKVVAMNNSSNATVTIPNDNNVNFPIGSVVYINRIGSGNVELAGQAGVTVSRTGTLAQFEELHVRKRAANYWMVVDVPSSPDGSGGSVSAADGYTIHTYTSGSSTFVVA